MVSEHTNRAQRLDCVRLAGAFLHAAKAARRKAGASSPHSTRFASTKVVDEPRAAFVWRRGAKRPSCFGWGALRRKPRVQDPREIRHGSGSGRAIKPWGMLALLEGKTMKPSRFAQIGAFRMSNVQSRLKSALEFGHFAPDSRAAQGHGRAHAVVEAPGPRSHSTATLPSAPRRLTWSQSLRTARSVWTASGWPALSCTRPRRPGAKREQAPRTPHASRPPKSWTNRAQRSCGAAGPSGLPASAGVLCGANHGSKTPVKFGTAQAPVSDQTMGHAGAA